MCEKDIVCTCACGRMCVGGREREREKERGSEKGGKWQRGGPGEGESAPHPKIVPLPVSPRWGQVNFPAGANWCSQQLRSTPFAACTSMTTPCIIGDHARDHISRFSPGDIVHLIVRDSGYIDPAQTCNIFGIRVKCSTCTEHDTLVDSAIREST
jgi:hypothetical protein